MPKSDPASILLAHDRWATARLLDVCAPLSAEQLRQPFELGPGSLQATLTHILGAMRSWNDVLHGRPQRPRLEQDPALTIAQLRAELERLSDDFAAGVRAGRLEDVLQRERAGQVYRFTRGAVLAHVTTHGMHHRAQCLNMLRQLGVSPLPPSSVMEWTLEADPAG